jgi:hypothetical protein
MKREKAQKAKGKSASCVLDYQLHRRETSMNVHAEGDAHDEGDEHGLEGDEIDRHFFSCTGVKPTSTGEGGTLN